MRYRQCQHRRGASLVEAAIVLPLFLTLVVSIVDLGLGILRYNKVAHSAREAAREASLRGSLAPPHRNAWGPNSITLTSEDLNRNHDAQLEMNHEEEVAASIERHVAGLDPLGTTAELEWLDGDNHWGSRVRVTVNSTYRPIMLSWITNSRIHLQSSCTVRIEH